MTTYSHFQEAKKANSLPMASGEQIGACLTCSFWQVETPRPAEEVNEVGLCVQPQLKGYALIVSGASACNKWKMSEGAGDVAKQYAESHQA